MQTLKNETTQRTPPDPEEIRRVLIESARRAGNGTLHVRGLDLLAALTGQLPDDYEPAR